MNKKNIYIQKIVANNIEPLWVSPLYEAKIGDHVTIEHPEALDKDGNFYEFRLIDGGTIHVLKTGKLRSPLPSRVDTVKVPVDEYKIKNKNTENPDWVLQRQPNPDKGETYIQIWFRDDALEISSGRLSKLLANVIQNQVKK